MVCGGACARSSVSGGVMSDKPFLLEHVSHSFGTVEVLRECETCSSRNGLSLITPPDTGDLGQAHKHAIDGDTDGDDHDHLRHQHIHAQAVARVHHGKSQTVAACDHFSSNNHQPAQPCGDAQHRDHLRHDGGQSYLKHFLESVQTVRVRHAEV